MNIDLIDKFKLSLTNKLSNLLKLDLECTSYYHNSSKNYIFNFSGSKKKCSITFEFRINLVSNIIVITYLNITPTNTGIGRKVVSLFFNTVSQIFHYAKIYLHPKNMNAEHFWTMMGFHDVEDFSDFEASIYNKVITISA